MGKTNKEILYQDGIPFEVRADGLFYCPVGQEGARKHPCPDCHFCQWCAEIRCQSCRDPENRRPKDSPP